MVFNDHDDATTCKCWSLHIMTVLGGLCIFLGGTWCKNFQNQSEMYYKAIQGETKKRTGQKKMVNHTEKNEWNKLIAVACISMGNITLVCKWGQGTEYIRKLFIINVRAHPLQW